MSLESNFPLVDNVTGARVSSCALVGNAARLLERTDGDAIDANELVARINAAPMRSYERHVGRRVHWRFVNDPAWLRLDETSAMFCAVIYSKCNPVFDCVDVRCVIDRCAIRF